MDLESFAVTSCAFFKSQMYVDRVVLFAYFSLLKDDLSPLKRFLNPPSVIFMQVLQGKIGFYQQIMSGIGQGNIRLP